MLNQTYLCVGKTESGCDFVAIGRRKILLVEETFLQLEDLMVGEGGARFPLLLRRRLRRKRQLRRIQFCGRKKDNDFSFVRDPN